MSTASAIPTLPAGEIDMRIGVSADRLHGFGRVILQMSQPVGLQHLYKPRHNIIYLRGE
jgi:hypothetical protein